MTAIMGTPVLFVNRFSVMETGNNIDMTIGMRLKQRRKELGLTQIELAAKVGLNQSTISDLEIGKSAGTTNLAVVANVLGVNALWLETGRGERQQSHEEPDSAPFDAMDFDKMSRQEMKILTMYRLASDRERQVFDAIATDISIRLSGLAVDKAEGRAGDRETNLKRKPR